MSNRFVRVNRIGYVIWLLNRLTGTQSLRRGKDGILDGRITRATTECIL